MGPTNLTEKLVWKPFAKKEGMAVDLSNFTLQDHSSMYGKIAGDALERAALKSVLEKK